MSVLYVVEQGAFVQKDGGRLLVKKGGQTLQTARLVTLKQVALFGNVQLSAGSISALLDGGIDTVFLTLGGRYRGRLAAFSGSNIRLRRAQFERAASEEFTLDLARRFVVGKIRNCQTLLRRQNRQVGSAVIQQSLHRMRYALNTLDRARTLDELRGFEGIAARAYFACFGETLRRGGFQFNGRNRRPPRDPVNAMLSFGYTMLLGQVTAAVQVVGLDPFLGSLHADRNGKPSLALDLMEEFRPVLVDATVVTGINRQQIVGADFRELDLEVSRETESDDEDEPEQQEQPPGPAVYLHAESIRKWIRLYESALARKVAYPRTGLTLTYRQVVEEQARLLARHYEGLESYQGFLVR